MYTVRDTGGLNHNVHRPATDIDNLVGLSLARCVVSFVGLFLVLTDVPRTGFAVDLFAYYPKVAPDTAIYYGPYAYPIVHLNRSTTHIDAYAGATALNCVDIWSYKYDSMSVPIRALAQHLNLTSFPRCVLYEDEYCYTDPVLQTEVAFTMLDDLVTSIQTNYFSDSLEKKYPMLFSTRSIWADRLHHVALGSFGHRIDRRRHSIHYFAAAKSLQSGQDPGINVCRHHWSNNIMQPLTCDETVEWLVDHPLSPSYHSVPLWESINMRFTALQEQYPDAVIDLTLLTTRSMLQNLKSTVVPTVAFLSDNIEVMTIIRGRQCNNSRGCITVFVDDYRYERATVETSSDELQFLTAILRGFSQGYIWFRVGLLIFICSKARLSESKYRLNSVSTKIWVVCLTIARIPSHVLVYSSWLPLIGYSLAHFIDCGLVHLISDSFWSTHNGLINFNAATYIAVASIQMRNIWAIGLSWKMFSFMHAVIFQHRAEPWRAQNGILALRGIFIGMTSFLTIFSFLRALRFRDTRVLSVLELPRHLGLRAMLDTQKIVSTSDFGHRLDAKTTGLATGIICISLIFVQSLVRKCLGAKTRFMVCRTYYVPLAAGSLYPASSLNIFWFMQLFMSSNYSALVRMPSFITTVRRLRSRMLTAIAPLSFGGRRRLCDVCGFISTPLQWRAIQGCHRHETLFDLGVRSVETQSMIRLINIAMMSDPLVFLRLRVFGKSLFLYRIHTTTSPPEPSNEPPTPSLVLSPLALDKSEMQAHNELVGLVDSSTVPWSLLVDCG